MATKWDPTAPFGGSTRKEAHQLQQMFGGPPVGFGAQSNRPRPAQQAPQQAPGFNEQNFNFGGLGAWGYQPQQQSPYLGAANRYAQASEFGSAVGGNVQMAGLPYGLAAALAGPTAQLGVAGTQGVTAQNLQQMQNEYGMNRLQQLLSFAGPLMQQGPQGIQATGAGGYSAGVGPQARVPKTVAMYT